MHVVGVWENQDHAETAVVLTSSNKQVGLAKPYLHAVPIMSAVASTLRYDQLQTELPMEWKQILQTGYTYQTGISSQYITNR